MRDSAPKMRELNDIFLIAKRFSGNRISSGGGKKNDRERSEGYTKRRKRVHGFDFASLRRAGFRECFFDPAAKPARARVRGGR